MRDQARALVLAVISLLTAMVLGIASAFMGAVALGATALIVPGTGTPNANVVTDYRENVWNWYIDGIACTDAVDCADPDLVGIDYPASFWPMSFLPGWCVAGRCEKWDVSVDEGTENMIAALTPFLDETSTENVFIFGYSQGGDVVANTLVYLEGLGLSDGVKDRLKVVTIGGIQNPDGGLWQRLAWLRFFLGDPVPILDLSFEPGMPVDNGIDSITIGFEYDPVVYAPRYWGNLLAVFNMIAAFDTVHGYYLSPNGEDESAVLPYGYTPSTLAPQLNCDLNPGNCRTDSYGNSYIMIPATTLPLTDLVRSLTNSIGIGALAKPFIDLVEPALRVMVDLGFDWSGDPGVTRYSTILPFKIFQNWIQVGVDLAVAAVKGVEAFLANFGIGSAATQLRISEPDEVAPSSEPADPSSADASGEADSEVVPLALTAGDPNTVESEGATVDGPAVQSTDVVSDVATEVDGTQDGGVTDEDGTLDEDVTDEDIAEEGDVTEDGTDEETDSDDAPSDDTASDDTDSDDTDSDDSGAGDTAAAA